MKYQCSVGGYDYEGYHHHYQFVELDLLILKPTTLSCHVEAEDHFPAVSMHLFFGHHPDDHVEGLAFPCITIYGHMGFQFDMACLAESVEEAINTNQPNVTLYPARF